MIGILDYGAGNLRSVENTLSELGVGYELARDEAALRRAEKIILPGVGHFGQMMRALDGMNLRGTLRERIEGGVPFLGICLGLQALFERSEEAPECEGLAMFPGAVKRFGAGGRVPHMGWNEVNATPGARLFRGVGEAPHFYFAHSFFAPLCAATAAVCDYTVEYTAALERGNVYGVQFHPEKSGPLGLRVMRNFVEL